MVLFGKELGAETGELTQVRNGSSVDPLMVGVGGLVVVDGGEVDTAGDEENAELLRLAL
jgi:hypothetical protein